MGGRNIITTGFPIVSQKIHGLQMIQVISMITHSATQQRVEALACWIKPMATRLRQAKQVMDMWAMLMLLQPNSLVSQSDSWVLNSETSADSHHECRFDTKCFNIDLKIIKRMTNSQKYQKNK